MTASDSASTPRRVGRPPRISRELIIEAAMALDPQTLTLQAVATRLGVDRKAISYYISGRQELLAFVAGRSLTAQLVDARVEVAFGDWRAAIRIYAERIGAALMLDASLSVELGGMPVGAALTLTNSVLQSLLEAGFDSDAAGRALSLVTGTVWEGAKEMLLTEKFGEHPTQTFLKQTVSELPDDALPAVRRVLIDGGGQPLHGLDFDLGVILAGLESWLAAQPKTD